MQAATATRRSIFVRGPVVVFLVLAYVGVLHYAYVLDIAPIFTYLQYGYRAPDPSITAPRSACPSSWPCSCRGTSSARRT